MTELNKEQLSELLDNKFNKHFNQFNDDISGIFIYGIIIGIILSYTGFLGYFIGLTSGLLLSPKYGYVTKNFVTKFQNIINNISSQLNKQINRKKNELNRTEIK